MSNNFLTPREYLAIERKALDKSDYWKGHVYPRPSASFVHATIQINLIFNLRSTCLTQCCEIFGSDLRVRTASGMYAYPDVVVVCGTPELEDEYRDVLLNPVLIAEVLSASTERYDRGLKFEQYRSTPTLREYLLVSSDHMHVELFTRKAGGIWYLYEWKLPEETVRLESCGAQPRLSDIYENVEFGPLTLR